MNIILLFALILFMLKDMAKAFIIGATMMVPGISGGTMAMVLAIYEKLIMSLSEFRKDVKKNLLFLAMFSISALIGIFLLARPILALINHYPKIIIYFFMGLVVGSIPTIYKETEIEKINTKDVISFCAGLVIVLGISFLPEGLLTVTEISFTSIMIHIVSGFLVSIGFILPGISFSYLLLVLGLYTFIIERLGNFDIISLLPFGFGFVLGVLIVVKAIRYALKKYPRVSYIVILGFLIGSLFPIFPGLSNSLSDNFISAILFILGFFIIFFLSKLEKR